MKNDIELQEDVLDELDWEPSINAADIGVTVKDGVVTLTGYVPSYADKLAVEETTLRVAGVRAVAEEIEVRLPNSKKRTDADLARAALNAIEWHVYLPEDSLKVKVEDRWVTLDGEVDWEFQRKNAFDAVRKLIGIEGVINHIKIKPRITPSQVKDDIRKALQRMAAEDANRITVEVQDGVVKLGGSVHSWVERKDAENAAWAAPGVINVEDNIKVNPLAYS